MILYEKSQTMLIISRGECRSTNFNLIRAQKQISQDQWDTVDT